MIAATIVTTMATPLLAADNDAEKRLNEAAVVFSEIMTTPDRGIPRDLVEKAHCIVIVPELKTAAVVVGGKYGKGFISCRNATGEGWSAPGAIRIEGGHPVLVALAGAVYRGGAGRGRAAAGPG
jgi:lipid-binding SYLF domain-containing protein